MPTRPGTKNKACKPYLIDRHFARIHTMLIGLAYNRHMKTLKLIITVISLLLFCASVVYAEYILALRLGIGFTLFVSSSGLAVLLGTLRNAPEGYEDEGGFHIKRPRRRIARVRRNSTFAAHNAT